MKDQESRERLRNERSENAKLKVHKDFGFLLEIKPIFINQNTAKYLLDEGIDEQVGTFKQDPFEAFISYFKYDYDGRAIEKVASAKISSDKAQPLRDQVLTMKLKEKAWFNVCDQPIHKVQGKVQEIEDGTITEEIDDIEVEKEAEEKEKEKPRTGFHYEVFLERIEFRNSDKMDIKRKINEQYREKGKKLFLEEKYYEASKGYKFLVHISQNLARNNTYTAEEKGELESMNINAKLNYIRCFFKIKEEWNLRDMSDFAKQTLDFLVRKKPHDHMTHFYHAKWLFKERVLDDALEAAKRSNAIKRNEATDNLINEIVTEKKNKGKIKVAVKK